MPPARRRGEPPEGHGDAIGDGDLEEASQGMGGGAEAPEFVGQPDADGVSTAFASLAGFAEEAMRPGGGPQGREVVVAVENAVLDEVAAGVAVGTGEEYESIGEGVPLVGGAVEAWQGVMANVS